MPGMQVVGDELRLVQGVRGLLNMILQGFMGVGLAVRRRKVSSGFLQAA